MNVHYEFSDRGYTVRMVVGLTAAAVGLLALAFAPEIAFGLLVLGASLAGATAYAKRRNEQLDAAAPSARPPAREPRLAEALEYRDLFHEGVISREEYHHAVASLYPELNRVEQHR